ncbi:hypothetical protein J1N09_09235 [Aureitalea sp. L0-47]|uniref:hypothetical protein n=1 Tax=Aureitalea sp. L0-47 TaxID=2816962 RepID=UPI0022390CAB|nr:hypothetical protein [Aureitalea sp. L0-47]MCW5520020.1 hypothetical protein [Aureitalea sp. L0-47]
MKILSFLLFFPFLCSFGINAQTESELSFPEDYFGVYKGTLEIEAERGSQEVPMEFHLKPTDTIGKYHYTLVYGEGDMRQERKYTLLAEDAEKGNYVVDENNGIILDDKVQGNRLYSLFEVQGTLLTTFMTFQEDHMVFEITAANMEKRRVSQADNEEKTKVISYPISTVQRAVLKKQ